MSSVVCQMSVRRMRPASAPQSICMVSTTAPIKKAVNSLTPEIRPVENKFIV